jgi:hypothetical protein
MKMKEILKEQVEKHIPSLIIGALAFLSMAIINRLILPILPQLNKIIDTESALLLLTLSIVINLAFLILIIVTLVNENRHQMPEPTLHYGIYFDYTFQPLCPSCKTPLQVESISLQDQIMCHKNPKLKCPNGHYNQAPTDDLGTELNIAKLRTTLIKVRYNIEDDKQ